MCGIVSSVGEVCIKKKYQWDVGITKENIIRKIIEVAENILSLWDKEVHGIGAAIPGLADVDKGIWVYSCFSGIGDIPIGEILKNKFHMPVFIDNDVNACAIGEKEFGGCKDTGDFFWITVSNGIGGGIVLNGDIYRGAFGNAGEIGHICVSNEGIRCSCGSLDCLEAHASGASISRRFYELTKKRMTAESIALLARKGDTDASEIFAQTGVYLGRGISYCINLLNLKKVIIGGGVAMSYDLFENEMKRTAYDMIYNKANENYVIEKTALTYDAALIGAGALVFKNI